MDRPRLSAAIIDEMAQLFADALRAKAAVLLTSDLDGVERHLQDLSRPILGRVAEEVVAAIAAATTDERPRCPHCQRAMRLVDYERCRDDHCRYIGCFVLSSVKWPSTSTKTPRRNPVQPRICSVPSLVTLMQAVLSDLPCITTPLTDKRGLSQTSAFSARSLCLFQRKYGAIQKVAKRMMATGAAYSRANFPIFV